MASYVSSLYHVVFSTKQRQPFIDDEIKPELWPYAGGLAENINSRLLEINGMPDHIHMLLGLAAKQDIAEVVQKIKANSSRWINLRFRPRERFRWQEGYGAFTISYDRIPNVRRYIQNQEQHHVKKPFKVEFIEFLERHGIEYDPETIWD